MKGNLLKTKEMGESMDRDFLIQQVKDHYQKLASLESKEHITQTTTEMKPEAYYERLLRLVIDEINRGTFDSFYSGKDIVEEVANNKEKYIAMWSASV